MPLMLIDATQLAANSGSVSIGISGRADIDLSDAPGQDSTASAGASLVSAWQSNLVAVKSQRTLEHFCIRWARIRHWRDSFGIQRARPGQGAGRRFAIAPLWCERPPCAVTLSAWRRTVRSD